VELSFLKKRPVEAADAAARSTARYRRIFLGGGMAVIAKSVTLVTTLVSVPLTIKYLGTERFGMWMTISSLISIIGFADLGLGNGLVSSIAHRHGREDEVGIAQLVSSAFFALLLVGACIFLVMCATYFVVPWPRLYSVTSELATREATPATFVFVACFCANLPLTVSQRVQMALQEYWIANIWLATGNILGLVGVILVIRAKGGLPLLTLAMYGGPVVATLLGGLVEFGPRRPSLRPRWSHISPQMLPGLFRTGITFFLLQILTMLGLGTDNLVIATIANASAVAPYAVMARYAQLLLVVNVFLQPLWPAFGEALGRGDYVWAKHALARASTWTFVIGAGIALVTTFFGKTLVHYWIGHTVELPSALVYGIALMIWVLSYSGVIATFMNNEGLVQRQVTIYFATVVVSLTLKVCFMHLWGISGIPWATSIAFGGIYCTLGMVLIRRHLGALSSAASKSNLTTS
jgi:O-antigen/teichoic acid export membrane protein